MNYKFEFNTKQKIIEIINLLILIIMIVHLIINWNNIGDTVPSHYNFAGQIDSWGKKGSLMLLPIIAVIVNISMGLALFFPPAWNIPVKVTEENCVKVYELTRNWMNFMRTTINISFIYINIMSVNGKHLGTLFLPIFLILIFMPMIVYFIRVRKV